MQREERQLEGSLDALSQRVAEVKNSIAVFIHKLETQYQTLNWPSVLDNFALLSGQINSLNRQLKNEKTPSFHNHICLPLVLSPDRDLQLEKLTEGRVLAFNHEVVPDYLRTKPDPDAEEKMSGLSTRANQFPAEAIQRQIAALNKISNNTVDLITNKREEWESELTQKYPTPQTCTMEDTSALIAATTFGKGLKRRQEMTMQPQRPPSGGVPSSQANPPPGYPFHTHGYYAQQQPQVQVSVNKAQSSIKTNIKSATSVHPYSRP